MQHSDLSDDERRSVQGRFSQSLEAALHPAATEDDQDADITRGSSIGQVGVLATPSSPFMLWQKILSGPCNWNLAIVNSVYPA